MAGNTKVHETKNDVLLELLAQISEGIKDQRVAPNAISEWALAYRYLAGGPQPGSAAAE